MNKNIKIAQELLGRYQSNQCTAEEQQAVEAWLDDLSFSGHTDLPDSREGDLIWNAIAEQTRKPSKPTIPFRRRVWITAAACFLAVLSVGLWVHQRQSATHAAIHLSESTAHVFGGLEIKPLMDEEVLYTSGQGHLNGEIQFCNMFLVKNLKDYAQKIKLKVDCEESLLPNNFVFQPGKSYIVVVGDEYNSQQAQQLYVAPADGLRRLPKGVELRVRRSMDQLTI